MDPNPVSSVVSPPAKPPTKSPWRTARRLAAVAVLGAVSVTLVGCLRVSNGTWYFKSAATPEGWPELTPVGKVELKEYPGYRAASVSDVSLEGDATDPMFMTLFRHISSKSIPMTAPVEMEYDGAEAGARVATMAFLYRTPALGPVGEFGAVRVEDLPARTFASVGVRGSYSVKTFRRGMAVLAGWFAENPGWSPAGPPRFLGYNGPFVPWFWQYGEVQVPVREQPAAPAKPEAPAPPAAPA